jgi:hypothetical protein
VLIQADARLPNCRRTHGRKITWMLPVKQVSEHISEATFPGSGIRRTECHGCRRPFLVRASASSVCHVVNAGVQQRNILALVVSMIDAALIVCSHSASAGTNGKWASRSEAAVAATCGTRIAWPPNACTTSDIETSPRDRPAADHHPHQLIKQRLGFAETQGEGTAQQPYLSAEPRALAAGFHIRRQRGAGAGGAEGTDQPVQPVLDHHGSDRRDLDHPMAQRLGIVTQQQGAAAATGVRVVLHHLVNALDRQQFRPRSRLDLLATSLSATAFASFGRLNPGPSLEGGWEELRDVRLIRSCRLTSSLARMVSCARSCSSSCLRPGSPVAGT